MATGKRNEPGGPSRQANIENLASQIQLLEYNKFYRAIEIALGNDADLCPLVCEEYGVKMNAHFRDDLEWAQHIYYQYYKRPLFEHCKRSFNWFVRNWHNWDVNCRVAKGAIFLVDDWRYNRANSQSTASQQVGPVPAVLGLAILAKDLPARLTEGQTVSTEEQIALSRAAVRFAGWKADAMHDDPHLGPIEEADGEDNVYLRLEYSDGTGLIDVSTKAAMRSAMKRLEPPRLARLGRLDLLSRLEGYNA